jgi:hypothetical protein
VTTNFYRFSSGATVFASVNGRGTIRMNKRGTQFGYLLPLDPGTNVIVLVAADATTNSLSSKVLLVERSNRYRAAITSPSFGSFRHTPDGSGDGYVRGYVSAKKDEVFNKRNGQGSGLTIQ